MPTVKLEIDNPVRLQRTYNLSDEKITSLLKFIDSITNESEPDNEISLLEEIEIGLRQVKLMQEGKLPKKTFKTSTPN
jgi:hypothetical protein